MLILLCIKYPNYCSGWNLSVPVPWRKSSSGHVHHDLPGNNLLEKTPKNTFKYLFVLLLKACNMPKDWKSQDESVLESYVPKPAIRTVEGVLGRHGAEENKSSGWSQKVQLKWRKEDRVLKVVKIPDQFQQQNMLKLWPLSICEEKQGSKSAELFKILTSHDMICETIKISNHWFEYDKNI